MPDLGGWDRPYMQWGSSLGGIISMIMSGVEPAVVATAPVSGGGGLFDVGLRTSLGTARNPIWLRVMGPILTSTPVAGGSTDTACTEEGRSIRFEIPDLSDRVRTEIACLPTGTLSEGDAVVLTDPVNGESRCAAAGADGRFRLQLPASEGDALILTVYDGGGDQLDFGSCRFDGQEPPSTTCSTPGARPTAPAARTARSTDRPCTSRTRG